MFGGGTSVARNVNIDRLDNCSEYFLGSVATCCCTLCIFLVFIPFFDAVGFAWIGTWEPQYLTVQDYRLRFRGNFTSPGMAFHRFDSNSDQVLDEAELVFGSSLLREPVTETAAKHLFEELDTDYNTQVDTAEFYGVMGAENSVFTVGVPEFKRRTVNTFESLPAAYIVFDSNQDNLLDQSEFEAGAAMVEPHVWAEDSVALFGQFDVDGGGFIEPEEFDSDWVIETPAPTQVPVTPSLTTAPATLAATTSPPTTSSSLRATTLAAAVATTGGTTTNTTTTTTTTTSTTTTVAGQRVVRYIDCLSGLQNTYQTPDEAFTAMQPDSDGRVALNSAMGVFAGAHVTGMDGMELNTTDAGSLLRACDQDQDGFVTRADLPVAFGVDMNTFKQRLADSFGSVQTACQQLAFADAVANFSRAEFVQGAANLAPPVEPVTEQDANALFDQLDVNHDGVLSSRECYLRNSDFQVRMCLDHPHANFNSFDSNADGALSPTEFVYGAGNLTPAILSVDANGVFSSLDSDASVSITPDEFCISPAEFRAATNSSTFDLCDADHSLHIDLNEFLTCLNANHIPPSDPQEAQMIFVGMDESNNSLVERDEFLGQYNAHHGHVVFEQAMHDYLGKKCVVAGHTTFSVNEPSVINRPDAATFSAALSPTFDQAFRRILNYDIADGVHPATQTITPDNDMVGQNRTLSFGWEADFDDCGDFQIQLRLHGQDLIDRIRSNVDNLSVAWMQGVIFNVFIRVTCSYYGPGTESLPWGRNLMQMTGTRGASGTVHVGELPFAPGDNAVVTSSLPPSALLQ